MLLIHIWCVDIAAKRKAKRLKANDRSQDQLSQSRDQPENDPNESIPSSSAALPSIVSTVAALPLPVSLSSSPRSASPTTTTSTPITRAAALPVPRELAPSPTPVATSGSSALTSTTTSTSTNNTITPTSGRSRVLQQQILQHDDSTPPSPPSPSPSSPSSVSSSIDDAASMHSKKAKSTKYDHKQTKRYLSFFLSFFLCSIHFIWVSGCRWYSPLPSAPAWSSTPNSAESRVSILLPCVLLLLLLWLTIDCVLVQQATIEIFDSDDEDDKNDNVTGN
jgi:hypothetical protein